ncbi:tetratricopeptide repeat protein [Salinimonas sp. HHU 13199]|uniref:Tetratricopeptide repeat protein n=1 Tax=Salinimonas profundi TaxID=2729140 RepID=A0ABR8LK73_9ALTE|nr:tetratricopeptide repeat protein [Salinimonas profundi]MBD3585486.1 tetratricopeptide repeat protein [Salinimonas profundi]
MQLLRTAVLTAAMSFSVSALAQSPTLLDVQHTWAAINYQTDDADQQLTQFESLVENARELVSASPDDAAALTWLGISQASAARAKGGLGALDYAEDAKENFEKAIAIDPAVLDGAALFSLGALYHKVPGWPVSFGDDDEAESLFKRALKVSPEGMDANYFYAEFLVDEGEYSRAYDYLTKAQQAPPRTERPLADKGRRQAIDALLKEIKEKR